MHQQNALEGPVLSDEWKRELAEVKAKFEGKSSGMDILPGRFKGWYERVVSGEARRYVSHKMELDYESSTQDVRHWLDVVDTVANELGVDPVIQGNEYGTIEAYFGKQLPYSKQDREYAQHVLDTKQYIEIEGGKIRWRKPIPTSGIDTDE